MEKLMAHQNQPIPSLQEVQTTVSKQLEAVFNKMVAKKMEDRYQSMSEVIEALEALGYGGSITGGKGNLASTIDLSSADRKKLACQARKSLWGRSPSCCLGKIKAPDRQDRRGTFATIIAPILVTYLIKHLEKDNTAPNPPVANAPAAIAPATVPPVVVASSTTTQPPADVLDDGSPKPLVAPFDAKQATLDKRPGPSISERRSKPPIASGCG